MKPIRILFPFEHRETFGGSHLSALSLASALDKEEFDPRIIIHFEAGAVGELAHELGLEFEVMKEPGLMGSPRVNHEGQVGWGTYLARTVPALRGFLKKDGAKIVHTNEGRMHANWIFPSKLAGCRHIWHHRQDPTAIGANILAPILADRIVCVSRFAKPSRPIRSIDHKTSVIHSPFEFPSTIPDADRSHEELCKELDLPHDSSLLGFFGNFVKRKRADHFIRSIAALRQAMPEENIHGLIFGEAHLVSPGFDAYCEELVRELELTEQIHFMGFRSPIEAAIAGVDVTLVPALNEPFGRTLIEAMFLGTPVVATDHGGNPEAIKDGINGFLVEPDNPESFVPPVKSLLKDPQLREGILKNAHEDASTNYTRQIHVQKMSALYRELALR
ncbi:MAG: glycosyltransferase family 4 protein [Pseudomonadota bacterium]